MFLNHYYAPAQESAGAARPARSCSCSSREPSPFPVPSRNLVLAGAALRGLRPGTQGTPCAPARLPRFFGGAVGARVLRGRASGARAEPTVTPTAPGLGAAALLAPW